jgi:hypothetical protein
MGIPREGGILSQSYPGFSSEMNERLQGAELDATDWLSLIGADRTKNILALYSLLGYLSENFEIAELDSHGLFAHQNELPATFGAQLDEDGCRK